jgi:hypothetical protein
MKEACFGVLKGKSVIKIEAHLAETFGKTHRFTWSWRVRLFAMVVRIRVRLDGFLVLMTVWHVSSIYVYICIGRELDRLLSACLTLGIRAW